MFQFIDSLTGTSLSLILTPHRKLIGKLQWPEKPGCCVSLLSAFGQHLVASYKLPTIVQANENITVEIHVVIIRFVIPVVSL